MVKHTSRHTRMSQSRSKTILYKYPYGMGDTLVVDKHIQRAYRFHYSSNNNKKQKQRQQRIELNWAIRTIFVRLRSATTIIIQNTFHRFFSNSSAAEKKQLNKILWFLFFCCIDTDGTKHHSKQSEKKEENHRCKSLLNINFNSLEVCCCGCMPLRSFVLFGCNVLQARYEFIDRVSLTNQNKEKRDQKFNTRLKRMIPFFFDPLLKWTIQTTHERYRVLSENIEVHKIGNEFRL